MRSRLTVILLLTICILFGCILTAQCKVIYVSKDGDNSNNGTTWALAKQTIQQGINETVAGDEVWVAKGTYIGCITLKSDAGLYGGFAGNETTREERNYTTNITAIDGNHIGSVVISPSGATLATVIDGFTIRNGNTTYGGGIYCNGSSPTISNNIITGNVASHSGNGSGGGIYCSNSSPVISNNRITKNNVATSGGGIYCANSSSPNISNNTIAENTTAGYGGGIYSSSSATISNNNIIGNSEGIYCRNSATVISNNTIAGNVCNGITCFSASPVISNNIVAFNLLGISALNNSTPILRNNCVYNQNNNNYGNISAGIGDISADPKVVSLQYGSFHIQPDSPCIDHGWNDATGISTTDIDNQARIQPSNGTIDIGADESNGTTWNVEPIIVRVDGINGNDANDGSSWSLTKKTIQSAIDLASAYSGEVWVKTGVYKERIILKPYAHLYGGFAGIETTKDDRNWTIDMTILDGNNSGNVVTASYICYQTATIDGFTIRNGKSTAGGGIYCKYASPNIFNNNIKNNESTQSTTGGGGIYCTTSAPNIWKNTITKNTASGYGGGIYVYGSPAPNISNNYIAKNYAVNNGGGISYNLSTTNPANIVNNIIKMNITHACGGGINCASSSPNISNNLIINNVTNNYGGGISCISDSSPKIQNNTIIKNTASANSGGIFCYDNSKATISNNIIAFNSSGICGNSSTPIPRNNCVYNLGGYNYSGLSTGNGDISADPIFLAPWVDDYHIRPNSPCIEAGYNTDVIADSTDFDGNARILPTNGKVDMGCYEYDSTAPYKIQELAHVKAIPEQFNIQLQNKPITAAFDGAFYIEDSDRICGIKVISTQAVTPGDLATITGHQIVDNGERSLQADSVVTTPGNTSNIPSALFVSNKSVGGSNFFWNYNNENCGQQGITDAFGLNNIGLLIKITGKFNWENDHEFTVNDGSGVSIKCIAPSTVTLNPSWVYVSVSGISSCELSGTELHRLIRVRNSQDIVSY